ncbi:MULTISPECIES: hypothetical protein [Acinetobacter]|jgi:hypothetical protein|uniref:Uncharacterized protein n=2 Tax=Acinetobacter TaxID=469 RepID=A0A7S9DP88_ACIJO|nr:MULTISPECIES: hypothetical protein [Acinetobacter]MDH2104132.1 hypothetical protein [Acinetobacter ursingii]PSD35952.1 hypothetical protein C7E16_08725 [Acinetobacter radioresistens]PSD40007.1 hypothetical protein C7E21_01565 [Acinetobacter radioresistens]QPG01358.1 hypothetical protein E10B_00044 [Acinetobacter johnsonii]RSC30208.1 hypothetical protein EGS47_00285 [Acinetobacter sp. FDAARGOS_515]
MEMLDPSNTNPGLFLVIMATAIGTILFGFLIVALIARYKFKIKVTVSSFIAAVTLSVFSFICFGSLGPMEPKYSTSVVQLYALGLLAGTLILNIVLLKLFSPKTIEQLALKGFNKSENEQKEHYKNILKEFKCITDLEDKNKLNKRSFNLLNVFKNKGKQNV